MTDEQKRRTPWEAYGVECGRGWRGLYEPLLQLCEVHGIEVAQVKEKFGGLRFYINGGGLDDIIRAAENESYHVCEDCGESGIASHERKEENGRVHYTPIYKATTGTSRTSGWIRTLCAPCREKFDAGRENMGKEVKA